MFTNRKGQSTLEYVVILTAVVAAIILAATQFVGPRVSGGLDQVTSQMQTQIGKINFSK